MKNADPRHVTEHLANERTYLAGLRTAFALISLGFATSRFGQFVTELQLKNNVSGPSAAAGSHRFGEGMVIFGTLLIVLSTIHYSRVRKSIESGKFLDRSPLIWIISLMSFAFGVTSILLFFSK